MPKVDSKAVLDVEDIARAMRVAEARGPFEYALFAWMYEFGARASEPGLQTVKDVDLHYGRARPVHLKSGRVQMARGNITRGDWYALLVECKRALPAWYRVREARNEPEASKLCLFPDDRPGKCYACAGTGKRPVLEKQGNKRVQGERVPCHHCKATGQRFGISRIKVHALTTDILETAGVPLGRRHPHVLRHSLITHLLDGGVPPAAIQDRVGHRLLSTTLGYVKATKSAAAILEKALYGGKT